MTIKYSHGRTREIFRGVQSYGRPRRGSGGGAPRTPENFRKFAKKIIQEIAKMHYFNLFFKKFQNQALHFRAFGRKTQLVGKILRNF